MKDDEITPEVRLAVHIRDDFQCGYCGIDLRQEPPGHILLDVLELEPGQRVNALAGHLLTVCRTCLARRKQSGQSWREFIVAVYGPILGASIIHQEEEQLRKQPNLELARAILAGQVGEVIEPE